MVSCSRLNQDTLYWKYPTPSRWRSSSLCSWPRGDHTVLLHTNSLPAKKNNSEGGNSAGIHPVVCSRWILSALCPSGISLPCQGPCRDYEKVDSVISFLALLSFQLQYLVTFQSILLCLLASISWPSLDLDSTIANTVYMNLRSSTLLPSKVDRQLGTILLTFE